MASKNNHRYKLRKRMNHIKHEPKSLFNEPATLISTWEGLDGLENDNYYITVELRNCCGWVRPKHEVPEDEYFKHDIYLSTHTFYGSQYFNSTVTLRRLGFNVQLTNWDEETIFCKH
jgi:hypothetical protein